MEYKNLSEFNKWCDEAIGDIGDERRFLMYQAEVLNENLQRITGDIHWIRAAIENPFEAFAKAMEDESTLRKILNVEFTKMNKRIEYDRQRICALNRKIASMERERQKTPSVGDK